MRAGAVVAFGARSAVLAAVLAVVWCSGPAAVRVHALERFYDGDPIEYGAGLGRAAGVVVVYRERVWDFVRDAQLDLDDIEWAIRNREWEELRRFSARMEADADAVGARGVRLYAEQMKILSRIKRPGKLRPCLEQLHFEVKQMIDFVKNDKRFERANAPANAQATAAAPAAGAAAAAAPAAPAAANTAAAAPAPATPAAAPAAAADAAAAPRTEL